MISTYRESWNLVSELVLLAEFIGLVMPDLVTTTIPGFVRKAVLKKVSIDVLFYRIF
jgi:hypothetical protein